MPTFHYYNGSNQNLCEEVIVDYVERTLADWTVNWTGDATFVDNVHGMMELNRQRYLWFNPTGATGHP